MLIYFKETYSACLDSESIIKKKKKIHVPIVTQLVKNLTQIQVQSLASISRLRIRCCCKLQQKLQMWLGSHVAVTVA